MNTLIPPKKLASKLYQDLVVKKGYTQTDIVRKICDELGQSVSQPSVSRILKGDFERSDSRRVKALCDLAGISVYERGQKKPDPRKNKHLMGALQYAWDGSIEHAKLIAKVIKTLKG